MEIHTLWPLSRMEVYDTTESFIDRAVNGTLEHKEEPTSYEEIIEIAVHGGYP